jgi:exopolysaccharide biosynthesis polyprenyl glycosylphosphotransferase
MADVGTSQNAFVAAPPSPARPISHAVVSGVVTAVDIALILLVATASYYLKFYVFHGTQEIEDWGPYVGLGAVGAVGSAMIMRASGGYAFPRLGQIAFQLGRVMLAISAFGVIFLVFSFLTRTTENWSRAFLIGWYLASVVVISIARVGVAVVVRRWVEQGRVVTYLAIVGATETAAQILDHLSQSDGTHYRVVGIFDDRSARASELPAGHAIVGTTNDLIMQARTTRIDQVIVAIPISNEERALELIEKMRELPVDVRLALGPIGPKFLFHQLSEIEGFPVFNMYEQPMKDWRRVLKRTEDIVLAGLIVVLLSPVLLAIAAAVRLESRGPALFRQKRYGFNNNVFEIMKFRTMYVDRGDLSGAKQTVRNDPRVTRIGGVLRRWSLDELPQLFNVLKGDMSLVGPRPHPTEMRAVDRLYQDVVKHYAEIGRAHV